MPFCKLFKYVGLRVISILFFPFIFVLEALCHVLSPDTKKNNNNLYIYIYGALLPSWFVKFFVLAMIVQICHIVGKFSLLIIILNNDNFLKIIITHPVISDATRQYGKPERPQIFRANRVVKRLSKKTFKTLYIIK